MVNRRLAWVLAVLAACGGNGSSSPSDVVHGLFVVPRAARPLKDFFELPFPNDIRLKAGGGADLTGFHSSGPLVDEYLGIIAQKLTGWGMNAAVYLRFDGELGPRPLP